MNPIDPLGPMNVDRPAPKPRSKRKRPIPVTVEPLAVDAPTLARMLRISQRKLSDLLVSGRVPRGVMLGQQERWPLRQLREWSAAGMPSAGEWTLAKAAAAKRTLRV